jgi:glutamine synthetase
VDKYAELLRSTVATAGNDHRLGANEAPPAIVSVFLGEQLTEIWEKLENGGAQKSRKEEVLKLGVSTLPPLPRDCTDRNRTSPFAFTGNKFEFRMVGSAQSTAGPCFVLNTIVADALKEIADELEGVPDVSVAAQEILKRIAREHKRIIFNGDNYSEDWVKEAEKRGLPNIRNAVDGLKVFAGKESVALFGRHGVLTSHEVHARYDIILERYCKEVNIEALTTLSMAKRQIVPAVVGFSGSLASATTAVKAAGANSKGHFKLLGEVCDLLSDLQVNIVSLEKSLEKAGSTNGVEKQSAAYRDAVIPAMNAVRAAADGLEQIVDAEYWPLPTYAEMLFIR